MVYCGCLENSWVNRPGGSNPSPSVMAMMPKRSNACGIVVISIAVFVVDSCAGICSRRGEGRAIHVQVSGVVLKTAVKYCVIHRYIRTV